MASVFAPHEKTADSDDFRAASGADRLPEELLSPVISGAYARGIADTFEMLGLPVLFLDGDGRILFASESASPFLSGPLRIRAQHLMADGSRDNRALADLIAVSLSDAGSLTSITLKNPSITLHSLALQDRLASSGQLLRAVILVDDGRDAAVPALIRRIASK